MISKKYKILHNKYSADFSLGMWKCKSRNIYCFEDNKYYDWWNDDGEYYSTYKELMEHNDR